MNSKPDTLKTIEWYKRERDVSITEQNLKDYFETARLWELKPHYYVGYAILPGQRYDPGQEVWDLVPAPKKLGYDYEGRCYSPARNGLVYSDTLAGARRFPPNGKKHTDKGLIYVKIAVDNPKAKTQRGYRTRSEQEYFTDRYTVLEICDGLVEDEQNQYWFKDGLLHRPVNEGPAVIQRNQNDIDENWSIEYWTDGQLADSDTIHHKASYCSRQLRIWTKNGVPHRDNDQPAWISQYSTIWYKDGLRHRSPDKPAVTGTNTEYYVNGVRYHQGAPDTRDSYVRSNHNGDILIDNYITVDLPSTNSLNILLHGF